MTSLVLEADLSQEQRELLEMVDASGKKLVTLLNDILDLSRFEAGKLSLAREPFSLRKTLDQVLKPLALPAAVQKEKTGAPVCMPGKECRRILLAEDTPVNAIFTEKILTAAGHSVVRASSGQEALDALSGNGPFDLVLMDVQMPGMDGLEAVRRIRIMEQDSGKRLSVAALTAYAPGEDRELCLASGMNDCIMKPVSRDALLAGHGRAHRRPGRTPVTLPADWGFGMYTRKGMAFFLRMGYGIGAINGPGTKGPAEGMKE